MHFAFLHAWHAPRLCHRKSQEDAVDPVLGFISAGFPAVLAEPTLAGLPDALLDVNCFDSLVPFGFLENCFVLGFSSLEPSLAELAEVSFNATCFKSLGPTGFFEETDALSFSLLFAEKLLGALVPTDFLVNTFTMCL